MKSERNFKGIPFAWSEYGEFDGININIIYKGVKGDSKGFDVTGISKFVSGNSKGFDVTGLVKLVVGDSEGFDITGLIKSVGGDSKGFDITGLYKEVGGNSKGVSITGGINYSKGVKDFLIQYGTLGNAIEEVNPDENFVLQIGLFNKIGIQYSPIVNVYGIKNIPKLIKKTFGKNKKILRK